jgi:hypothetical protein
LPGFRGYGRQFFIIAVKAHNTIPEQFRPGKQTSRKAGKRIPAEKANSKDNTRSDKKRTGYDDDPKDEKSFLHFYLNKA